MTGNIIIDFYNDLDKLKSALFAESIKLFDKKSLSRISRSLELAEEAHASQYRDEGTPYILHPIRTALSLLYEIEIYESVTICAALLHDTMEDSEKFSFEYISAELGEQIGGIVRTLTKPDKKIYTREKINQIYFERILNSDENIKLVKLADKLDNVRNAISSPDINRKNRTAAEASAFFVDILIPTLTDKKKQAILLELFNKALINLHGSHN